MKAGQKNLNAEIWTKFTDLKFTDLKKARETFNNFTLFRPANFL